MLKWESAYDEVGSTLIDSERSLPDEAQKRVSSAPHDCLILVMGINNAHNLPIQILRLCFPALYRVCHSFSGRLLSWFSHTSVDVFEKASANRVQKHRIPFSVAVSRGDALFLDRILRPFEYGVGLS